MTSDRITVETLANAPVATVWEAYTAPDHVRGWNFASPDWHCPSARADLREGGEFSSRMEAKDGSMGFDFEGVYTKLRPNERIEYRFGERHAEVDFIPEGDKTRVRISFEPETEFPREQQQSGWQAILDNFAKYVAGL